VDHPGTPILHTEKFARGLGNFSPAEYLPADELPDDEYRFILTTGRTIFHYHTGTMTRRSKKLDKEMKTGYVEISPQDAQEMCVEDGETVRVSSRRGTIDIPAFVTKMIGRGVVFIPFHFVECAANALTNTALDPKAKIPELKVCAVKVEKV
jgi:formate dehydrogenase major subunit